MRLNQEGFIAFVIGYLIRMLALVAAVAALLYGVLRLGGLVLPVSAFMKYGETSYILQKSLELLPHVGEAAGAVFTTLGVKVSVPGVEMSLLNEITSGLVLLAVFQLLQIYDAWVRSLVESYLPQSGTARMLENIVCTTFLMAASCTLAGIVNEIAAALLGGLGYGGWLTALAAAILIVTSLIAIGKSAAARGGFFIDLLGKLLMSVLNVALIYAALLAISVIHAGPSPTAMLVCVLIAVGSILAVTLIGAWNFAKSFQR